jgi:hypothetical protein
VRRVGSALRRRVRVGRLQHRDIAQLLALDAQALRAEHALLPDLVAARTDRHAVRRY